MSVEDYVCPFCERIVAREERWHFAKDCVLNELFVLEMRRYIKMFPSTLFEAWRTAVNVICSSKKDTLHEVDKFVCRNTWLMYLCWVIYAQGTHDVSRFHRMWDNLLNEKVIEYLVRNVWRLKSFALLNWLHEFQGDM